MAPKLKLHSKQGKPKAFPTKITPTNPTTPANVPTVEPSASTSNSDAVSPPVDNKFELELCWCIQQLELSLSDKKTNPKQVQTSEKILKTLKSNSQPLIKKRQLMRTHFGDYRSKMAAEEKKSRKVNQQISFTKLKAPSSKSVFYRKAILGGDNNFRFNFNIPNNDAAPAEIEPVATEQSQSGVNVVSSVVADDSNTNPSKFQFKSGEFKFNFNIDSDML